MEKINVFLRVVYAKGACFEFTIFLYDVTFGRNRVRCMDGWALCCYIYIRMYLHDNQICFKGIFHDKLSQPQVPICLIIHSQQLSFCNGLCTNNRNNNCGDSSFRTRETAYSRIQGHIH
jgi:hypothetical protein